MRQQTLLINEGYMVVLKTSIKGGVYYDRQDLGEDMDEDGTQVEHWETFKRTDDPQEYERAKEVRQAARNRVANCCVATSFGLIFMDTDGVAPLDEAVLDAEQMVDEFNATSETCRIRINVMRGRFTNDEAAAARSIARMVDGLMEDLHEATRTGDVKNIRDLASRARDVARLLADEADVAATSEAIAAARAVATEVVRRVEKGAETLESVLQGAELKPIATARFRFSRVLGSPGASEDQETAA